MNRIAVNGANLNLVDEGHGPPVVLVHGFPLDHTMWRHQRAALHGNHRVILPDLRGFGSSDGWVDTTPMELFADDLAALLDECQVRDPITLVGLSMGGYIAFQFWLRHRARLARLVLCDTRAVSDPEEVARGRLQMAERALREGSDFVADAMLGRLVADTTRQLQPEIVDELRHIIRQTSPRAIAAAQRGMAARPDVTSLLSQIDCPTMVLCGEHDVISPVAEMRAIATAIPNACFVEIPDAGHMAPLEQPTTVNAALTSFLT